MNKYNYYKILFYVAASWNWFAGIMFLLISLLAPDMTSLFGMERPPSFVWFHLVVAMVLLFGIFFFMTSRNLEKYHDIALFFVVEKFIFFSLPFIYFFLNELNIYVVLIVGVDLFFGVLFLEFWMNFNK